MKRRELITLLGGAATWPLTARAQQPDRMRRIGVLLPATENDPEFRSRLTAFQQALHELGWIIGSNVRLEIRWATPDIAKVRQQAAELVALAPDVILATGGSSMAPLQRPLAYCRSYLYRSLIRSLPALSIVWRGRVATPPVSLSMNME
jgi:putative ABC transport system substrate-binding protein